MYKKKYRFNNLCGRKGIKVFSQLEINSILSSREWYTPCTGRTKELPEVQIAHLACAGSEFARIALTYCFHGREYAVNTSCGRIVRFVAWIDTERRRFAGCNGTAVTKCNDSVSPSLHLPRVPSLGSRHASFLVSEALSRRRAVVKFHNCIISSLFRITIC